MSDNAFKTALVALFIIWIAGTVVILGLGAYRQLQIGRSAVDHTVKVMDYCYRTYSAQADIDRCVATGYAPE